MEYHSKKDVDRIAGVLLEKRGITHCSVDEPSRVIGQGSGLLDLRLSASNQQVRQ